MASIRESVDVSAKWAAIAIGFSVPISVALDNVLMLAVFLLWLAGGGLKEKLRIVSESRVSLAALALIGLLAIGMFYGKASFHEALDTFGKYIDLLFVPVFLTLFRDQHARRLAIDAFVLAMLTTLLFSYLLKFGMLHQNSILRGFQDNPYVFKLYITQNFFMAYCALILAVWSFFEGGNRLIHVSLAMLAAANVLFMVQGRTGYIVLAAFILYLFFRKFGKKGLLVGMMATALLGTSAYFGSNAFRERVEAAASEFSHWHEGHATKDTNSIGQRLEYDANTLALIEKHPLFGVGTGGFRQAYAEEVKGTAMIPTHHPHNEFLLIASQLGMPGLFLLLLLFRVQWREAERLPFLENYLARGLVLAMVTGCLFNSFLLDHAEGLFYSWMTGVLFSARREA